MRFALGSPTEDTQAPPEGEEWRRIRSPSSRLGYLLAGLVGFLFPSLLFVWLIVVSVASAGRPGGGAAVATTTPWGVVVAALLLYVPLHELLHAIWHPGLGLSARTVMVVWPRRLRFGVYYGGCMSRGRWLAMRMAPLVGLSVLPVGLLTLFHYVPAAFAWEVFLQVLMLVNGIGSGGDVVAVVWVLYQVPRGSQICFFGGKAYWRSAQ